MTTAAAREALLGRDRSRSGLLHKWQHALPPARDRVWRSVITLFVSLGRPPYLREIGEATGVAIDQLREIMTELEAHDLLGIDKSADRVRYAYPFTGEPNEHRVQLHGRELHALCAIDALGIGDMLGTDVVITASCRACGKPIEVTTAAGGKSWARRGRPMLSSGMTLAIPVAPRHRAVRQSLFFAQIPITSGG